MSDDFEDLIEELLDASLLSPLEKGEIRRELESHFYEEVNELQLKGWSNEKIKKYIRERFGSPEQIGKTFWTVYSNKTPFFIFYSSLLSMFTWIKSHPTRALSLALLAVFLYGNYSTLDWYFVYKNQGAQMMGSAIDMNIYDPSKSYVQREDGTYQDVGGVLLFPPLSEGEVSSPTYTQEEEKALEQKTFNADLDEDGKLTIREANVYQVITQIGNLEAAGVVMGDQSLILFFHLLLLLDAIGFTVIVCPWLSAKKA